MCEGRIPAGSSRPASVAASRQPRVGAILPVPKFGSDIDANRFRAEARLLRFLRRTLPRNVPAMRAPASGHATVRVTHPNRAVLKVGRCRRAVCRRRPAGELRAYFRTARKATDNPGDEPLSREGRRPRPEPKRCRRWLSAVVWVRRLRVTCGPILNGIGLIV